MHFDEIFRIGKYLLSSEYSPVEYIGFDGSSWLDLSPLTTESDIEITFRKTATNTAFLFGINPTGPQSGTVGAWVNSTSLVVQNGNVRKTITLDTDWHTLKITSTKTILDGVEYDAGSCSGGSDYQNLVIGGARDQTSGVVDNRMFKGDISSVKVGNKIFIPVKDVVNNTFGLLDLATNTFYGNSGTGTITGGNEIPTDEFKTIGSGENKIWERAIPTTTTKSALVQFSNTRKAVNLYDYTALNKGSWSSIDLINGDSIGWNGATQTVGTAMAFANTSSAYIHSCKVGDTFTIKFFGDTGGTACKYVGEFDANGVCISKITYNTTNDSYTYTAQNNGFFAIQWAISATDNSKVMVVKGSTVPSGYYPYFSPQTILSSLRAFGATPVKHKAPKLFGQYIPAVASDTVKWPTVLEGMGKFILNGNSDENWTKHASIEGLAFHSDNLYKVQADIPYIVLCDRYDSTFTLSAGSLVNGQCCGHTLNSGATSGRFCVRDLAFTDVTTLRAKLASNPLTIYYPLADPTGTEPLWKFVKDIGLDGTGSEWGYFCEDEGVFVKVSGASGHTLVPISGTSETPAPSENDILVAWEV